MLTEKIVENVRVVPNLAAHSEGFERVGEAFLSEQVLGKRGVQLPLKRGHFDQDNVLNFRREVLPQYGVAPTLDEPLKLGVQNMGTVHHEPHVSRRGVYTLPVLDRTLEHV